MIGQSIVYETLQTLGIDYDYYEAPGDYKNEDDAAFWSRIAATHCKNLFMRNYKGDRHFLIISDYNNKIDISILEQKFKKGKISFASQQRIDRHIKGKIGAISVFNLFNDTDNHVEVFIDQSLLKIDRLTFLPNDLNAIIAISFESFIKTLKHSENKFEFIDLVGV